MEKYAKFINETQIEFAPVNRGAISNYNLDVELMIKDGYKPVVIVEEPNSEKPVVKYREKKKSIEQYCEAVPALEPYIPTQEEKEFQVRCCRNNLLSSTDKFVLMDFPISNEQRENYIKYRQYLRDYTKIENWWENNPKSYDEFEG